MTEVTKEISVYSQTEAGLAELRKQYEGVVFDVATTDGDKKAREARKMLVSLRTSLEAKRKEIKVPALAYAKAIDTEAARITGDIRKLEDPIDEQIKAREAVVAAEKAERERIEKERQDLIARKIDSIRNLPVRHAGATSAELGSVIEHLESWTASEEDYQEFQGIAEQAAAVSLEALNRLRSVAEEAEARERQQAAERAELDRLRAEQEEREAQALKLQQEREAAERQKLAAERADQDRLLEEARAQAKAEQERLDAERAQFERQRAEFQAQQEAAEKQKQEQLAQNQKEMEAKEAQENAWKEARKDAGAKFLLEAAAPADETPRILPAPDGTLRDCTGMHPAMNIFAAPIVEPGKAPEVAEQTDLKLTALRFTGADIIEAFYAGTSWNGEKTYDIAAREYLASL